MTFISILMALGAASAMIPAGHKALFKWLDGWTVERIAYEATGAYHRAFEQTGHALPL